MATDGVHRSVRAMLRTLAVIPWFHLLLSPMCGVTPFSPPRPGHNRIASITRTIQRLDPEDAAAGRSAVASRRRIHGRRWSSSATSLFSQPPASPGNKEKDKTLTPSKIAELVEVSFLQSCLQLSQGYVDVLKLFIVTVKTGYEYPLGLEELNTLVETCPVNSAGRDLTDEEKGLRLEWMRMVYEMMNALRRSDSLDGVDSGDGTRSSGDGGAATSRISAVSQAMLSIQNELQNEETTTGGKQDATVAINTLTVEQVLKRSPSLSKMKESTSDLMEKAFLTNDIRVALMTFRVLEEERICTTDSAGSRVTSNGSDKAGGVVPRPPIPGT